MAQETIYKYGVEEITVPYGQKIAISNYGGGTAIIYYQSQPGNVPPAYYESQRITNEGIVLGTFSADQNIKIDAQNSIVNYEVGTEFDLGSGIGGDPNIDFRIKTSLDSNAFVIDGGTGVISFSNTNDLLSFDASETVFNDDGADIDFRIETSLDSNAFVIDGGTGVISFSNTNDLLSFDASETIFNDSGADIDFRIESNVNANSFFLEGSSGNFGFNNGSLKAWDSNFKAIQLGNTFAIMAQNITVGSIHIMRNAYYDGAWKYIDADEVARYSASNNTHSFYGGAVGASADDPITWIEYCSFGIAETVFNNSGSDINFRIESDTNANAFFLEGSSSNIGINTTDFGGAGPGTGVIGIANATAPTANPTGGGVLYVDSADGALKFRGAGGTTTTIAVT